ncbi:MAG: zinc metallopeptidase [Chloroflexi bacterium]|nr:zinc metallopeptidase [Chloroflexota bacterium]
MFFDPNYILLVMLPTLVITGLAQAAVRNAYQKWGNIRNSQGLNGQQTAQLLMRSGSVQPVGLEVTGGQLTDHYDPTKGVVRLSQGVAMQPSVASMAVAAHEFGHVQQHQQNSALMSIRSMLVPSAQFGPSIGIALIIMGLIFNATGLATIGLVLFAAATLFTIVTLPVELDASRRAMRMLEQSGLIATEQDRDGANAVLRAAALTYVAAVATSILTLLYYAMLVFGGRRRN